jgi:transcriptional regulator with XRE-family HTH domain
MKEKAQHSTHYTQKDGRRLYEEDRARRMADPEFRKIYEAEAARKDLWLQLVEARHAAGLTQAEVAKRLGVSQAQVARLEKRGYEDYSLNSLRRYVEALGEGFQLEVRVRRSVQAEPDIENIPVSHKAHAPRPAVNLRAARHASRAASGKRHG